MDLPSIGKAKQQPDHVIQIIVGTDDRVRIKLDQLEPESIAFNRLAERVKKAQRQRQQPGRHLGGQVRQARVRRQGDGRFAIKRRHAHRPGREERRHRRMSAAPGPPESAGLGRGVLFALIAHAALVAALSAGVSWRSRTTPAFEAALGASVPQVAAPPEETPPPPTATKPEPEPPKAEASRSSATPTSSSRATRPARSNEEAERRKQAELDAKAEKERKDKLEKDKKDKAERAAKEAKGAAGRGQA